MVAFTSMVITAAGLLLGGGMPPGPAPVKDTTMIRFWGGTNTNAWEKDKISISGHLPEVILYNEFGEVWSWGYFRDWYVGEGSFFDLNMKSKDKGNTRPTYIQLNAYHEDAVCLSAIQITFPDASQAIIYGDVPVHACDWPGYPSITDFPISEDSSTGYHPWCFWLDGNDSFDQSMPRSVSFHLPDFNANNMTVTAYNANRDLICKSQGRMRQSLDIPATIPIFSPPLSYDLNDPDADGNIGNPSYIDGNYVVDDHVGNWPRTSEKKVVQVRNQPPRRASTSDAHEGMWVVSQSADLKSSAEYVCSRPNAVGPHYANLHERKFCKINDRTVWDLCDGKSKMSNCFDMESKTLLGEVSTVAANETFSFQAAGEMAAQILKLETRIDMNDA